MSDPFGGAKNEDGGSHGETSSTPDAAFPCRFHARTIFLVMRVEGSTAHCHSRRSARRGVEHLQLPQPVTSVLKPGLAASGQALAS